MTFIRHLVSFVRLPILWSFVAWFPLGAVAKTTDDFIDEGNIKKAQGNLAGAISDYTQAIALDAGAIRGYLNRGIIRNLMGDHDGAIADETQVIVLDPKNAVAYSNRGNAKRAKADFGGSMVDYTEAIALDPQHLNAYLNRGNLRYLQKDYSGAITDYTAAIALSPKNVVAFYDRAASRRAIEDDAGALNDYGTVIGLDPMDVHAYLNRAILKIASKNWDGATADLNKCLSILPEVRQAYPRIFLWVTGVEQGKYDISVKELEHYLDDTPKTFDKTWPLQIVKYLVGRLDQQSFLSAAGAFEAKEGHGQMVQANFYIGLKCLAVADKKGAIGYFSKCDQTNDRTLHEDVMARSELKLLTGANHVE
jgi:tetratricopeptide (TPR) repeat protein